MFGKEVVRERVCSGYYGQDETLGTMGEKEVLGTGHAGMRNGEPRVKGIVRGRYNAGRKRYRTTGKHGIQRSKAAGACMRNGRGNFPCTWHFYLLTAIPESSAFQPPLRASFTQFKSATCRPTLPTEKTRHWRPTAVCRQGQSQKLGGWAPPKENKSCVSAGATGGW